MPKKIATLPSQDELSPGEKSDSSQGPIEPSADKPERTFYIKSVQFVSRPDIPGQGPSGKISRNMKGITMLDHPLGVEIRSSLSQDRFIVPFASIVCVRYTDEAEITETDDAS